MSRHCGALTQFLEPPQKGKTHLPLEGCLWAPGPPHTYPLPSYISSMLALLLLALFAPPPLAKMAHPHNTTTFFCLFLQTFRSPKCSQRQYHAAHATRGGLGPRAFVNFLRDLLGSKAHPGVVCCGTLPRLGLWWGGVGLRLALLLAGGGVLFFLLLC